MLTGWPGKTANNGTNDWGLDPWGALVRVNGVSGTSRPYVDGQVDDGPDIMTFTGFRREACPHGHPLAWRRRL